jgi:hypothetical protein
MAHVNGLMSSVTFRLIRHTRIDQNDLNFAQTWEQIDVVGQRWSDARTINGIGLENQGSTAQKGRVSVRFSAQIQLKRGYAYCTLARVVRSSDKRVVRSESCFQSIVNLFQKTRSKIAILKLLLTLDNAKILLFDSTDIGQVGCSRARTSLTLQRHAVWE